MFEIGGPMLWPLTVLGVITLMLIGKRGMFWLQWSRRRDVDYALVKSFLEAAEKGDAHAATRIAEENENPLLKTLFWGLENPHATLSDVMTQIGNQEIRRMEKYAGLLRTSIPAALLLGVLGAVLEIMKADAVGAALQGALIPAAVGLAIALYCLFAAQLFHRNALRAREELEKAVSSLGMALRKRQGAQGVPEISFQTPDNREEQFEDGPAESMGGLSEKEKRFFLS